jgi:hypothetical protein
VQQVQVDAAAMSKRYGKFTVQQMQADTAAKRYKAEALADTLDQFMVEHKDDEQMRAMLVHGRQMALTIRMIGRG